ncbi:unnamed protein product [Closterium sp. Naga37s-1]|nr:unnamed protein product [Closterium sp. Naga37s-1]
MRGSNDRVEVFKLSENLWFAGTAQLPPFESDGDGGNSNDGDSSGNHGNRTGGDIAAGDGPRGDSIESRREALLARIRGGGMDEKTREALLGAANAGGDRGRSASAPAAAPASVPAPAVDPLAQQMEQRMAEVGEFAARTTELKQVVKRKPAFFGLLPQVVEWRKPANTSVFGDSLGDMTCTYDRLANRFFLSSYWMVSCGGVEVNDGINSNPDWRAPLHFNSSRLTMFLDYPQIGTDAYGMRDRDSAIAKSQLQTPENATILRFVVPYTDSPMSPAYTIYPQKVAADGDYDYRHGGTMYFGWAAVNSNPGAPNETVLVGNYTTIGAFALTSTSALGTPEAESRVEPHCAAVNTPPFFDPQPVTQKPGPVPLAWKLNTTIKPISPAFASARGVVVFPESRRMWVTFMSAFGKDMSASAVVARLRLSLRPNRKWRTLRVFLERFKVVGVGGGNSLIQPSIALNRQGVGIIAASLAGRSFYPSAAYVTLNANVDVGRVVVTGPGKAPLDDFFGYLYADAMQYGDYMTATIDEEGNAWAAVQYVAGQTRTEMSNWATFVFKVDLQGGEGEGDGGDF